MQEQWIPVAEFDGAYEISSIGRLKSCARPRKTKGGGIAYLPERIKIPGVKREGYAFFSLYKEARYKVMYLHRLVAIAFIHNPLNLPQVNHIDGNKLNNCASNLEWVSASDNCRHALETGLYTTAKGESAGNVTLTESDVLEIRRLAGSGMMQKDIAAMYPVNRQTITKIVNRQRWRHI